MRAARGAPLARRRQPPTPSSSASGCVTGAVVSVVVQPLDVLRTRMQADAARGVGVGVRATAKGVFAAAGARGFWAGVGPTVARLSAGLAIQFLTIDTLRDWALERARERERQGNKRAAGAPALSAADAFLVGGGARALSSSCTSPITLVKTRMEFAGAGGVGGGGAAYRSTAHALATIARTDGVRGLFRGLGPTVAANAPFSALYYTFYSRLQARLAAAAPAAPGAAINFSAGALAAVAATVLTQPADMVRTHMQLGLAGVGAGGVRLGPVATLRAVVRARGASALLAGTGPRVVKRTLQTALVWTLYEELQPRVAGAVRRARGEVRG